MPRPLTYLVTLAHKFLVSTLHLVEFVYELGEVCTRPPSTLFSVGDCHNEALH